MSQFQQPGYASKDEAQKALTSDNYETVVDALIGAAINESDRAWVEGECLKLVSHENAWVRKAVATSVAHLARIHRAIDPKLINALELLKEDKQIAGAVDDALDDIRQFVANN